jgi:hypothetical protein
VIFGCVTTASIAQTSVSSESLLNVSDSVIKKEVSSFSKKGKLLAPNTLQAKLNEIPISNCSDRTVNWAASKFFSSISTFIHVYFLQDSSVRKVDSIFLVTHSHFWVKFPNNAYNGIVTSASCNFSSGKKKEFYSDYYKAFYSNDKKRLYIYLIGGTEAKKYEVTWVVVNDKYWGRVIDDFEYSSN